jgi:hypothetical protein
MFLSCTVVQFPQRAFPDGRFAVSNFYHYLWLACGVLRRLVFACHIYQSRIVSSNALSLLMHCRHEKIYRMKPLIGGYSSKIIY